MKMGAVCLGLRVITWSSDWWGKNGVVVETTLLNNVVF